MTIKPRQSHKEETRAQGCQAHADRTIALPPPLSYLLGLFAPPLLMALLFQVLSLTLNVQSTSSVLPNRQSQTQKQGASAQIPACHCLEQEAGWKGRGCL